MRIKWVRFQRLDESQREVLSEHISGDISDLRFNKNWLYAPDERGMLILTPQNIKRVQRQMIFYGATARK